MVRIDENQEAVARIRLTINEHDARRRQDEAELNDHSDEVELSGDGEKADEPLDSDRHWKLRSPDKLSLAAQLPDAKREDPMFHKFESKLRDFFTHYVPDDSLGWAPLKVCMLSTTHGARA